MNAVDSLHDCPPGSAHELSNAPVATSFHARAQAARPIAILGSAESLFPLSLARAWKQAGRDVVIVSDREPLEASAAADIPIHVVRPNTKNFRRRQIRRVLARLETVCLTMQRQRVRRVLGTFSPQPVSIPWMYETGCAIAEFVVQLQPAAVFGMDAMAYGLATAWSPCPKLLMPWGADIYLHGPASSLHYWLARRILHSVDLLAPTSETGVEHLHQYYGVPRSRIRHLSWGIDLEMFQPATTDRRREICQDLKLPTDRPIVLNVRRFQPLWGSQDALAACLQVAALRPEPHFLFLGGPDTDNLITAAETTVSHAGFSNRFHFLRGNATLEKCRDAMQVADIFTSLMHSADMRSGSVLQGAACGGAPVLTDQAEFQIMERSGFCCMRVDYRHHALIAQEIVKLLDQPQLRKEMRASNLAFLRTHEDMRRNIPNMLQAVDDCIAAHRQTSIR